MVGRVEHVERAESIEMKKLDEIRGLRRGVGVWSVGVESDFVWSTIASRMKSACE